MNNNNNNFNAKKTPTPPVVPTFSKLPQSSLNKEYRGAVAMPAPSDNQLNIGQYRMYSGGNIKDLGSNSMAPLGLFGNNSFSSEFNHGGKNNNINNNSNSFSNPSPLKQETFSFLSSSLLQSPSIQVQQSEAELWEGPVLFDSGFVRSSSKPDNAKSCITDVLDKLTKDGVLDWTDNNYELTGRMFDNKGEMSEFRITIWKASENSKYNSIIHIRKQAGNEFLHGEFQNKILELFQDDIKNNNGNNNNNNNNDEDSEELNDDGITNPFAFDLTFPSLDDEDNVNDSLQNSSILSSVTPTLDYNFDIDMDNNNDNNDNNNDNEIKNNDDLSLKFDSKLQLNNNNDKDNKQENIKYLQKLVDDVCDCEGFMECMQTSACLLLRLNDTQFKILSEINNIIGRLLQSIIDQFDVQQIRNILKIIERLLQLQQNIKSSQQMIKNLKDLREKWQNGTFRKIGDRTIKFGQSQQIVVCCDACIRLLDA